jgi:hypothetical protein
MRRRAALYFGLYLALVAILTIFALHRPEQLRDALMTYAFVTWMASGAVVIFEKGLIAAYVRRRHPFYFREMLTAFRARHPFMVGVHGVAGSREFLESTDSHGDLLLSEYRRRSRQLRWVWPLVFVQSAAVMIWAVVTS